MMARSILPSPVLSMKVTTSLLFLVLVPKMEAPKYLGAVCETAGQFAYIYAIADTEHLAMSAPIIASYCAASVLWSRIFLKEKLSWKHYAMIALIVAGIAIMGVFDL